MHWAYSHQPKIWITSQDVSLSLSYVFLFLHLPRFKTFWIMISFASKWINESRCKMHIFIFAGWQINPCFNHNYHICSYSIRTISLGEQKEIINMDCSVSDGSRRSSHRLGDYLLEKTHVLQIPYIDEFSNAWSQILCTLSFFYQKLNQSTFYKDVSQKPSKRNIQ